MMNKSRFGAARRDGLLEGAHNQVGRHPPAECAPDDLTGAQVFDVGRFPKAHS